MAMVVGAFEHRQAAARGVDQLMAAGFSSDQIAIHSKHGKVNSLTPEDDSSPGSSAEDPDRDATGGAGTGQSSGVGALPLGGVALAGGAGVAGGGLGGTTGAAGTGGYGGGILPYFLAEGVPDDQAQWYADRAEAGKYLVAVRTDPGREVEAQTALAVAGAEAGIQTKQ